MGKQSFRMRFPFKGLSKDLAVSEQPPETSEDLSNARAIDPVTGRTRGAQRAGWSKYLSSAINGSNKVRRIDQITYDQKTIDYASAGSSLDTTDDEWTSELPSKGDCFGGAVDRQGNVYAIDGTGVVKLNPEGKEVWKFALPVVAEDDVLKAIRVDELDGVFVGSTHGARTVTEQENGTITGDQSHGRLWHLLQLPDNKVEVAWELETGWVADIGVDSEERALYVVENRPKEARADLVKYTLIDSANPLREVLTDQVPYPATGLAIGDGAVFTTSEENRIRPDNPLDKDTRRPLVGWTPENINDGVDEVSGVKARIWAWHRADVPESVISTSGSVPKDGADVIQWVDQSGNHRDWFGSVEGTQTPPKYVERSVAGVPAIRFDGVTSAMRSLGNIAIDYKQRDQQKTIVPSYLDLAEDGQFNTSSSLKDPSDPEKSGMWCMVMAVRPAVADTINMIFSQQNNATANDSMIVANSSQQNSGSKVVEAGQIAVTDKLDNGAGAVKGEGGGTVAINQDFDNKNNIAIVSLIFDAGVDQDDTTKTHSLLRVNGLPIDRWQSSVSWTRAASELGLNTKGAHASIWNTEYGEFDILEMIVFDRKDPESASEPKIISHPFYPDVVSGTALKVAAIHVNDVGANGTDGTYTGQSFSGGGGTGATASYTIAGGVLTDVEITNGGSGYTSAPTFSFSAGFFPFPDPADHPDGLVRLYDPASDTDLEKVEGYMGHKYGVSERFPSTTAVVANHKLGSTVTSKVLYPHPYALAAPTTTDTADINKTLKKSEVVCKWKKSGAMAWGLDDENGVGLGVVLLSDGTPITIGDSSALTDDGSATGPATIVKLTDNETSASVATSALADTFLDDQYYRMDVDAFDRIYVPGDAALDLTDAYSFKVLEKTSLSTIATYQVSGTDANKQGSFAVVVPKKESNGRLIPSNPDYEGDLDTGNDKRAEFVWMFGTKEAYGVPDSTDRHQGTDLAAQIRKVRLVTQTHNTNPPRATTNVAVAGGAIRTFTTSSVGTPSGVPGSLDSAARFVDSASAFGEVFFVDGKNKLVYNPKDDDVALWQPTSAGEIPAAELITTWQARVVLGRLRDDPQNWAMSAQGDPYNWDLFPPVIVSTQAVSGIIARAGRVPDIVNAIIPVSDDILVLGGDRSIWRLVGNPTAGGELEQVHTNVGIAFGRAWARDDKENIYFISSRGGLYVMDAQATRAQEITEYTASRDLQDGINLNTHNVELAWDARHEGLWIVQTRYGSTVHADSVTHWFFDLKNPGLWPDSYSSVSFQPTTIQVLDGDQASDRVTVIGSNAFVEKTDESVYNDDGNTIHTRVLMGPYPSPILGREARLDHMTIVLADDQHGARYNVYASSESDDKGLPQFSGTLHPGRNNRVPLRARGSYFWIELKQSGAQERFAFEEGFVELSVGGKSFVRTT